MTAITETKSASGTRPQPANYAPPAVNIHQDADGYTLEVEMPGVPRDGVDVTFEDGKLTLTGHRAAASPDGLVYRESPEADYRRVFDLNPDVDASRIEAKVEQGPAGRSVAQGGKRQAPPHLGKLRNGWSQN